MRTLKSTIKTQDVSSLILTLKLEKGLDYIFEKGEETQFHFSSDHNPEIVTVKNNGEVTKKFH